MFNFTKYSVKDIQQFYSTKDYEKRFSQLVQKFQKLYNVKPDFIARAPGRVNIIGEHIDYQGYGVLPAAIQKDCLICVKTTQQKFIYIDHLDSQTYPAQKLSNDPEVKEDYINNYIAYFMAGYRAGTQNISKQKLVGMKTLMTGNVPTGSGLSSSSALCVCSALAAYQANNQSQINKVQDFIQATIRRERQSGTASGGMDQSISVMGKLNSCLYIQFNPIRCQKVHVPQGCKLIIMNSLVQSLKVNTAVFRYNKRVIECRLALYALSSKLKIQKNIFMSWKILKDLQEHMKIPIGKMSAIVKTFLQRKEYTLNQIQSIVGEKVQHLIGDIQLWKDVVQANKTYKLCEAAIHVFDEAQRVLSFIQICNSNLNDSSKNIILGKLMNESQFSCSKLYECSCQELDQLTETALKYGALGSRLTGAGWGGCTVSLVQDQKIEQFMQNMKNSYYKKVSLEFQIQKLSFANIIFQSKPCEGACIISL